MANKPCRGGWTARAETLCEEVAEDAPERGWVCFLRMFRHLGAGEFPEAKREVEAAVTIGRRHRNSDLMAMATCSMGRMMLYAGQFPEGIALLDEAMVCVLTGELSPVIAGHVFCTAIEGCQEISDFARVAEWTAALETWCDAQPGLLAFTGQCAVHRGQLLRLHGEWPEALDELDRAVLRYREVVAPNAIGVAAYESGDILRLRGEFAAADEAYERAADHGFDPQPGLALLWLARGQLPAAAAAITRQLHEPGGPVQRCRVLPAAVEILLAAADVPAAHSAVEELTGLAAALGALSLDAMAAQAAGAVALASGDGAGALPYLRKARQLWTQVDNPYERARARLLIGRALSALGDDDSARRDLTAARDAFRALGATPDAVAVDRLMEPGALPGGLSPREAEVLRLVATGRSNPQIAADLVISEKTVARHLSNIFTKLNVGSRTAAAAYAFEHHLV